MKLSTLIKPKILKNIGIPLSFVLILSSGNAIALPQVNLENLPGQLFDIISQSQPRTIIFDDKEKDEDKDTSNRSEDEENTSNRSEEEPPEVVVDDGSEEETNVSEDPRFLCEYINGQYTVMYYPESQPGKGYPWAVPTQMGGGWSPERRCNEITARLESYRADGLVELGTTVENGYDIVCVTTSEDLSCRIVFTVPSGQDPLATRDRVFQNLIVADSGERTQGVVTYTEQGSNNTLNQIDQILKGTLGGGLGTNNGGILGGSTNTNTNTNTSSVNGIDLRPFLDPSDGGTGELLKDNRAIPATPSNNSNSPNNSTPSNNSNSPNSGKLNPDLFR